MMCFPAPSGFGSVDFSDCARPGCNRRTVPFPLPGTPADVPPPPLQANAGPPDRAVPPPPVAPPPGLLEPEAVEAVNTVGATVAAPPTVTLRDTKNRPLPGATVTFQVT